MFGMRRLLLLIILLTGCATASVPEVTIEPVVATERAFAARAGEVGWVSAFREFWAAESQMAQQGLVPAAQVLAGVGEQGSDTSLFWWPAYAGIARSGDLAFTTGPFSVDASRAPVGQYFTVWRKQADGNWRWVYDGGPGPLSDFAAVAPDAANVESLAIASSGRGSAEVASTEVTELESAIRSPESLAAYLAPGAHVYRRGQARATSAAAAGAILNIPSPDISYRLLRTEASAAGDLVIALGNASWRVGETERTVAFLRVWQWRGGRWLIVYDQLA